MQNKILKDEIEIFLNQVGENVAYCLARGQGTQLFEIGCDLDLVIARTDIGKFDLMIKKNEDWQIINTIKRYYVTSYFLFSKKTSVFFQIDCEFDFDWWGLEILNTATIIDARKYCRVTRIFYASDLHSNTMKLYRTLIWGQRLKEKYLISLQLAAEKNLILCTKPLLSSSELNSLLFKADMKQIRSTARFLRRRIVIHNFKKLGFLKVMLRFLKFLYYELRVLRQDNGVELEIINTPHAEGLISYLKSMVYQYKSPFKQVVLLSRPSTQLTKLKRRRDATLSIITYGSESTLKCHAYEDGSIKIVNSSTNLSKLFFNYEDLWCYLALNVKS